MELQIPFSICTKIPQTSNIWKYKGGRRKDITRTLREKRNNDHRSRMLPGSCTYAGRDTAEIQCIRDHGIPERKKLTIIFDRHANLKYKYGNRHFWCRGYYVDTVGKNAKKIEEYIRNQLAEDKLNDQISLKEYTDPFTGEPTKK